MSNKYTISSPYVVEVDTYQLLDGEVVENETDAFRVAIERYKSHWALEFDEGQMYAPCAELVAKVFVDYRFEERPYWVYKFKCYEL